MCGRGTYPFICVMCGNPGIGNVPGANTHKGCKILARKKADAKFRAKKKKLKENGK